MLQNLAKFILNLLGWKVTGAKPSTEKGIFIVAPHTHWLDIPLGLLVRLTVEPKVAFVAKRSLFQGWKGKIFYALGGFPVDRSKSQGFVDSVVHLFNTQPNFYLALAPEGTRQKVTKFRTGFYYIAFKANIPMYLTKFDFENKEVHFSEPHWVTSDAESSIAAVEDYFRTVKGKNPERNFG